MKAYINQFYNEGFATTFYLKPLKHIENNVKNESIKKVLKIILKVIYTILILIFAAYMFKVEFPFL